MGVHEGGTETNGLKDSIDFIIPMPWAPSQTIESIKKKPVFLRICLQVARWRADNGNLLRWKNALATGILTVTLTKQVVLFNHKTDKKSK